MREREVKLEPPPGFHLPALHGVAKGVTVHPEVLSDLDALYYDTSDLRLARAGASLRFRDGWTVKLPAGMEGSLLVRGEHTFGGAPGAPPDAALDLVRAWVRTARVGPVARLRTRRRRVELTDARGARVAEVVDDEVTVLRDGRITGRFRELEVELGERADRALADALIARLQAAGAGHPDPVPKIVRALGAVALEPPEVAAVRRLPHDCRAGDVVRTAIAGSVAQLLAHDGAVRLGEDEEAVHQARVATRRLRSDLRTFRSLLVPEWDAALRDELRWLGNELGAVRDTDVLLGLLRSTAERLPEPERGSGIGLTRRLAQHREGARAELLVAMRSRRYAALLDRLVEAAHAPALAVDAPARDTLPALVRGPWSHLAAAVAALPADPADEALHAVRIHAKRCRYAAEAVAPVVGKRARRFARRVQRVQEALGDHQDTVIAVAWLRDAATHAQTRGDTFAAGMMAGMVHDRGITARAEFASAWRAARRKQLRAWL